MRIVFVYKWGISLGVGYLASYIKQYGHEVGLVFKHDTFANSFVYMPFLKKVEDAVEDTINAVIRKEPDIVAFSVSTSDYQWALDTSKKIKSRTDVPIIFGGIHPTLLPDICIRNEQVDMVCIGEGELALAELLNSMQKGNIDYSIKNIWFKKGNEIIKNGLRPIYNDLDKLPFPDRELFFQYYPRFWKREIGFVLASRGCPFACSYCGNAAYNQLFIGKGKILRLRNASNVIEECVFLKNKYNVKKIHFQDDLFASNTVWLEEFISKYNKEVRLPFTCLSHPKVMSRKNIELLKEGGCRLTIVGIQSGSERIRKEIFNRKETNEDIVNFSKACHETGLNFSFNHIFDAPTETEEDIIDTAKFYNSIRPKIIDGYVLVYFPKAEIIKMALKTGILSDKDVDAINDGMFEGIFQGGFYKIFGENYKKYSMLFVLIPFLPQKVMSFILKNKFLVKLTTKLPIKLSVFIKIFLNMRCGSASFHFVSIRHYIYRVFKLMFNYFSLRKKRIVC